jgi:hypothetical protein
MKQKRQTCQRHSRIRGSRFESVKIPDVSSTLSPFALELTWQRNERPSRNESHQHPTPTLNQSTCSPNEPVYRCRLRTMIREMILDIGTTHLIRPMDTIMVHHHIQPLMAIILCHHLLFLMIPIEHLHHHTITPGHLNPTTHLLMRSINLDPSLIRCRNPMVLHLVNMSTRLVNANRCLLMGTRSLLQHITHINRMDIIDSQSQSIHPALGTNENRKSVDPHLIIDPCLLVHRPRVNDLGIGRGI